MLNRIQHDLFDLGADLATPADSGKDLRIVAMQVQRLEKEIDAMNATLAPLNSFVLPGGSPASAQLHLARTLVRRTERVTVALADMEPLNAELLHYMNRLSDHLFVLARVENKGQDVLWEPGKTR